MFGPDVMEIEEAGQALRVGLGFLVGLPGQMSSESVSCRTVGLRNDLHRFKTSWPSQVTEGANQDNAWWPRETRCASKAQRDHWHLVSQSRNQCTWHILTEERRDWLFNGAQKFNFPGVELGRAPKAKYTSAVKSYASCFGEEGGGANQISLGGMMSYCQ